MNAKPSKQVLIVEDEPAMVKIVSNRLEHDGIKVIYANDGEAGLSAALANHPDLILLDILMPKMHGMELLRKLRAEQWGKQIPVIILTNLSDPEKETEAIKELNSEYYVKANVKFEDIIDKIKLKLNI